MYALVTPTFIGHFRFISKYIESVEKYCKDKDQFVQYFVIGREEYYIFRNIIDQYRNTINIKILFIEDLFQNYKISISPDNFLKKYGKYTFQTIKKILTLLDIKERYSLLVDSEGMFISETKVSELFKKYFSKPWITYSNIELRRKRGDVLARITELNSYLLKSNDKLWYVEQCNWFIDRTILEDMLLYFEGIHGLLVKMELAKAKNKIFTNEIFEGMLYYGWIKKNNEKYHYREIDLDKEFSDSFTPKELNIYENQFYRKYNGEAGIFEFVANLITGQNKQMIFKIIDKMKPSIFRFESTDFNQFNLQNQIIKKYNIKLLACSQDHLFGLNYSRYKYIYKFFMDFCRIRHYTKNINENIYYRLIRDFLAWLRIFFVFIYRIIYSIFFEASWVIMGKRK